MRAGLEVFFDLYLLCVFVSLFPEKIRKYIKYFIFSLLFIIGIIDMICYKTMGIAMSPNILQTWMLTNNNEATEAISQFFSLKLLLSPISLFFLIPLIPVILKRINFSLHHYIIYIILFISSISGVYGINNKIYLHHVFSRVSDDDMKEYKEIDTMTREYLPIYRLLFSWKEINRFSGMGEKLLENISKTNIDSCSFKSPNIVLIIGESYNKYHSSLYGYNKNTTPYQQILKEKGCLYLFNDVISSYNLTFKSFQNMLSLYSIDKLGVWYNYPLLMPLFRKAGYEVNFFSNQYCIDKSEAFSDFIEDMFINNKQLDKHFFDNRNPATHNYDDELLNDYITLCDTTGSKPQLNIFHFIGIHAEFNKRFPEGWNKFKTTDYNRDDLDNSQKQILADYDNAIAYNDYVINNIISFFENKNSIIIYVPDHGELIFDNGPEFGRNLTIKKEIIKPQYDIPFWIYCTPEYKANNESLCNEITCSLNKPFMTDDLPHLILYLAGINADCYEKERNIISSRFNVNRKRLIQENIDYDKLVLNPTNTKIL